MAPLERSTRVLRADGLGIAAAAAILRAGGLVAFPTETVYGLGADALSVEAVRSIFLAKGRPPEDPLIVHLAEGADVPRVARVLPEAARTLAEAFWPGPLTLVLPRHADVPLEVTAGLDSVGVRVPSHPVARALIRAAGLPVAAPSANLFSRPSPTRAEHVLEDLRGRVDAVLDGGPTPVGVESTIVSVSEAGAVHLLRPGGVPVEAIEATLGRPLGPPSGRAASAAASGVAADAPRPGALGLSAGGAARDEPDPRNLAPGAASTGFPDGDAVQRDPGSDLAARPASTAPLLAPGLLETHYAPRTPLALVGGEPLAARARLRDEVQRALAAGQRVGVLLLEDDADLGLEAAGATVERLGAWAEPAISAARLFDALRALDRAGLDALYARHLADPTSGLGRALADRLHRAAARRITGG